MSAACGGKKWPGATSAQAEVVAEYQARLRAEGPTDDLAREFLAAYAPVIAQMARSAQRRTGCPPADRPDLRQEITIVVWETFVQGADFTPDALVARIWAVAWSRSRVVRASGASTALGGATAAVRRCRSLLGFASRHGLFDPAAAASAYNAEVGRRRKDPARQGAYASEADWHFSGVVPGGVPEQAAEDPALAEAEDRVWLDQICAALLAGVRAECPELSPLAEAVAARILAGRGHEAFITEHLRRAVGWSRQRVADALERELIPRLVAILHAEAA